MTTSHDTTSDTGRGQESSADLMRLWADNVQKWISSLSTLDAKSLDQIVDNCFDAAERVLETQREFTKKFVAAAASAATNAASAVQNAAQNTASKKS
ncbi:MAG: hypothetical protein JO287_07935 [Pseudonocardiales bacterium]|nr:hypothetical protein [Pseudonocardiales bacterium]